MNQKGFTKVILIAVVIIMLTGVVGYFMFIKKSGPEQISSFPVISENGLTVNGSYRMFSNNKGGQPKSSFINISTGETYQISNQTYSVALGDGFGVWVEASRDPNVVKGGQFPVEFDLYAYNFTTKKEELLLSRINNRLNPNAPQVATSGRKIALLTMNNTIILIDYDSKNVETIPMISSFTINVSLYSYIYFVRGNIVVAAWSDTNKQYATRLLFRYNITDQKFYKLYESSSRQIDKVQITPEGEIYWQESNNGYPPRPIYKMKISE